AGVARHVLHGARGHAPPLLVLVGVAHLLGRLLHVAVQALEGALLLGRLLLVALLLGLGQLLLLLAQAALCLLLLFLGLGLGHLLLGLVDLLLRLVDPLVGRLLALGLAPFELLGRLLERLGRLGRLLVRQLPLGQLLGQLLHLLARLVEVPLGQRLAHLAGEL